MIKEFFGTTKPLSLVVSYLETTFQLGGKSSLYAGGVRLSLMKGRGGFKMSNPNSHELGLLCVILIWKI